MAARLEPIVPGHIEPLSRFLASFPNEKRPLDYWRRRLEWWWLRNPHAGQGHWGFALWDGREPVGMLASVPGMFILGGRPVAFSNASTWRVAPSHRQDSLKTLLAVMGRVGPGPWFAPCPTTPPWPC